MLRISPREDPYDASRILTSALMCSSVRYGVAVFPVLAPSWSCPVDSSQAQQVPPSPETPLPRRLPRLPSRLHSLVFWRASPSSCASLERGQKPSGSSEAHPHRGLRLSQPAVYV